MKRVLFFFAVFLVGIACGKSGESEDLLSVVTEEVSDVSGCSATLHGYISPRKIDAGADLGFFVSTFPTLEHRTEVPLVYVDREGRFYAQAKGLYPCTTYYYSAYVRGAVSGEGGVRSFTTGAFTFSAVNIGLSVKWANANLGAASPEQSGEHIPAVYGESGVFSDAVAEQAIKERLGDRWRLPTQNEMEELVGTRENPDYGWEWRVVGGRPGWEVACRVNGRSIFFPAAGWYDILQPGIKGPPSMDLKGCWNSGCYPASGADSSNYAHLMFFTSSGVEFQTGVCLGLGTRKSEEYSSRGFFLRPVLAE